MQPDRWAVLMRDEGAEALRQAAPGVASATGVTIADALHRLVRGCGFVMERAERETAERVAKALCDGGVEAFVVPQADVVEAPEATEIRGARVEEKGLFYQDGQASILAPWEAIVWVDLVEFAERRVVAHSAYESDSDGDGSDDPVPVPRTVEERPLAMDLVVADPLRRLRLRNDRFRFAATGLKMHANKRQNSIALAIAIGSRATLAEFGPGMEWLREGTPPRPERFDDPLRFDRLLRARLTRMRCE